MSQDTIQRRAAAVRKTWTFADRLNRTLVAHSRRQRLLEQLGLVPAAPQLVYACLPARRVVGR